MVGVSDGYYTFYENIAKSRHMQQRNRLRYHAFTETLCKRIKELTQMGGISPKIKHHWVELWSSFITETTVKLYRCAFAE